MRFFGMILGAAVCLTAFQAQAAPTTYRFTASVFFASNDVGLFGAVSIGDVVTGEFTIDPSDVASAVFSDTSLYFSPNAHISASVSGIDIAKAGSLIQVTDDSPFAYDSFDLFGAGAGDAGTGLGYGRSSAGISFRNEVDPGTFTSLSIPSNLSLSDFEGRMNLALVSFNGFVSETELDRWDGFTADITSLERVTAVPLPAGLPLLALGLALLGTVRRLPG